MRFYQDDYSKILNNNHDGSSWILIGEYVLIKSCNISPAVWFTAGMCCKAYE